MHVHEDRVDPTDWYARSAELAVGGATMFDMLTAVDDPGSGSIQVVAHVLEVDRGARHLTWTSVDRDDPVLASMIELYPGAAWHEREVHEMFGVRFTGNPDLSPLLTTGDMGFPLRRTTPLPARIATAWPGAVEPSDRPVGGRVAARPRSRPAPPGVPPEWQS